MEVNMFKIAIFKHTQLRNWDICHTVGPTCVSLCRKSLQHGIWTTVWHSSPLLCHSENADADLIETPRGVRKDGNHRSRGPKYRVDDQTPPSWTTAGDVMTVELCVVERYRAAKHWASRAVVRKKNITDGTSQSTGVGIRASIFNRCNNATLRTRKVPVLHSSCDVITLSHGCAKVAHCVPARWHNFSHYCRPLRQYDVFWAQRSTDRRADSRRCTQISD